MPNAGMVSSEHDMATTPKGTPLDEDMIAWWSMKRATAMSGKGPGRESLWSAHWGLGAVIAVLGGCTGSPGPESNSGSNDGDICGGDAACTSGMCSEDLCLGAACSDSELCREGWVCKTFDFGSDHPVLDVLFGTDGEEACVVQCSSGCPEHWMCDPAGSDLCIPESGWSRPAIELSWSGATSGVWGVSEETEVFVPTGEVITAVVGATSPIGATLEDPVWTVQVHQTFSEDEVLTYYEESVELSVPEGSDSISVYVTVTDADGRASLASLPQIYACLPKGETCTADPDGCCGGCDATDQRCL